MRACVCLSAHEEFFIQLPSTQLSRAPLTTTHPPPARPPAQAPPPRPRTMLAFFCVFMKPHVGRVIPCTFSVLRACAHQFSSSVLFFLPLFYARPLLPLIFFLMTFPIQYNTIHAHIYIFYLQLIFFQCNKYIFLLISKTFSLAVLLLLGLAFHSMALVLSWSPPYYNYIFIYMSS